MKPSLEKLHKFFRLEIERGYDNHAVMGGLDRILGRWEGEARQDGLPQELIGEVIEKLRLYATQSPAERAEVLPNLWQYIQHNQNIKESLPTAPPVFDVTPSFAAGHETPSPAEASAGAPSQNVDGGQENSLAESPPSPALSATELVDQDTNKPIYQQTSVHSSPSDTEPVALNAPVTVLPGVGARNAQNLSHLGLRTLRDLLYYFPRRYDDYTQLKPINRLVYGEEVTVIATVESVKLRPIRNGAMQIVEAVVSDGTGSLRITWFNQGWVAKRLHDGAHIVLSGKIDQYLGRLVMSSPEWEPLEQQQLNTNRIVPVYPLTAQITQHWLRRTMNQLVAFWAPRLVDYLPEDIRRQAGLVDLSTALIQAHFPDTWDDLRKANERLAFEEIFLLQLGVLRQKHAWQDRQAQVFSADPDWIAGQIARLPFALTGAQRKATQDVLADLGSGRPMNRLIQGDVGSGKTVIAALAITIVTQQTAQAAFLAPTTILAEQHYNNLLKLLTGPSDATRPARPDQDTNGYPLPDIPTNQDTSELLFRNEPTLRAGEIRLMVGSTPEPEKRQIQAGLLDNSIKLVIGTHALIEDPVRFANLQLAVVDEQHRFGVDQRSALRSKGDSPHLLVMTATPIPRTLALTVYGDLDLTVMDEMPPGRQPVSTFVLEPRDRERAYSLIRAQVKGGRQAFIIYPLVEENEKSETSGALYPRAAVDEHLRLQSEAFSDLKLGLLHGRLRPDEKDEVMTRFRDGETQILVSTSVVEVGVDVPNATVMLIEGANRFGLAQLHQFRGRVGRGADQAYCILIPDTPDSVENERLQAMVESNDGFILAERDLEQRGPGQFLGTRQSGFSELKVATLSDVHLIEKARRFAQILFEQDPALERPDLKPLKVAVQRAWGDTGGDIS